MNVPHTASGAIDSRCHATCTPLKAVEPATPVTGDSNDFEVKDGAGSFVRDGPPAVGADNPTGCSMHCRQILAGSSTPISFFGPPWP